MVVAALKDRVVPHLCFETCAPRRETRRLCDRERACVLLLCQHHETIATAENLPCITNTNIPMHEAESPGRGRAGQVVAFPRHSLKDSNVIAACWPDYGGVFQAPFLP